MHLKAEVKLNPWTNRVLHYPWNNIYPGDTMELTCPSGFTARAMVYRFAKRNGWKVETVLPKENTKLLIIYRIK